MKATKEQMCKLYGCTMEQLNSQFKENASGLNKMADKAKKTGVKVNGFTGKYLSERAEEYKRLSQC